MASKDIENISRGKKVMVLLYLDFTKVLENPEQALVEQVVKESTDTLFGIDPGSTKIALFQPEDKLCYRSRLRYCPVSRTGSGKAPDNPDGRGKFIQ
jgi:hypothetical protein